MEAFIGDVLFFIVLGLILLVFYIQIRSLWWWHKNCDRIIDHWIEVDIPNAWAKFQAWRKR